MLYTCLKCQGKTPLEYQYTLKRKEGLELRSLWYYNYLNYIDKDFTFHRYNKTNTTIIFFLQKNSNKNVNNTEKIDKIL
jgi:hypothetical protein